MSCGGGHLGFPIGIKNSNLVKDLPMIIPLHFGFSQFISFREEDLWNFTQSVHIIGPGSHIEYPRNIPAKFGSNRPSGFGEEAWNVKSLQTTDNRRQVMAIVHLDLWSRWTKNEIKTRWPVLLWQFERKVIFWIELTLTCTYISREYESHKQKSDRRRMFSSVVSSWY